MARSLRWFVAATVLAACSSSDGSSARDANGAGLHVVVRDDLPGQPIDRRVLGTNLPAWVGPTTLADPAFRAATVDSGTTLLRMPGGSWSNAYDWLGCEQADPSRCYWTWAARPTDFVTFMQATGLPGMWTLSANTTAQSAAAAVAFFNGAADDTRPIGTDRNGTDWGTVGRWATLRVREGNPEPAGIELWEVGNEVYGGKPASGGDQCASFGWEDVWTCDGATYVDGDAGHDGYLAIRAAMLTVDPTIEVGAVGVADPDSWSGWGREVIEAAGDQLDFYSIHQYGFDRSPDPNDALRRPASMWPEVIGEARSLLAADVPLAVTEYNLVSMEAGDTDRSMTRAVNALFMADTIGQLVTGGVGIANQWNLVNGTTASGTDYGMIDATDGSVFPQYEAMALWGATGDTLLATEGADAGSGVRVYPTRRDDGSLAVVVLNLGSRAASLGLEIAGRQGSSVPTVRTWRAARLDADMLTETGPASVTSDGSGGLTVSLPAWSLNLLEVAAHG